MSDPGRWLHRSIFARLVAIMVGMALSLLLMVAGFFKLVVDPGVNSSFDRLFEAYADGLADRSPDLATARQLAEHLGLRVRYQGPGGSWATDERMPAIAEVQSGHASQWILPGWGRSRRLVSAPDGGVYLISWEFGRGMSEAHDRLLGLLLLLMGGVVLTAHLVLSRALGPLRELHEGVQRLSGGDLEVVLPERTRDELGALTAAFNQMVGRVKEMVRSRDQLLLDVSHELRSPLTRLKVALALLPEGDTQARMSADLAEMEAMIAELLELERLREGRGLQRAPVDLVSLLREAAAAFEGVRLQPGEPSLVLDVDAGLLRRVLRNLLENAVKYALPDSQPVELSITREGDAVLIRVRDDGPGIPEADLPRLFEPFFRVDRSRSRRTGGYGLGLSICKRILEAHGGEIAVRNQTPRGAQFTLRLPA